MWFRQSVSPGIQPYTLSEWENPLPLDEDEDEDDENEDGDEGEDFDDGDDVDASMNKIFEAAHKAAGNEDF